MFFDIGNSRSKMKNTVILKEIYQAKKHYKGLRLAAQILLEFLEFLAKSC